METLVYIDLTLASEAPTSATPILDLENLNRYRRRFNRQTLSRYARRCLPPLFILLSMFPMVGEAFVQILQEGSRGPLVTQLQERLLELNYFHQEPTGYFGSKTKDAVMRFQGEYRLNRDGVVGRETWSALFDDSFALNPPLPNLPNSIPFATYDSLPSTREVDYEPTFSSDTESLPPLPNFVPIRTSPLFPGQILPSSNFPNFRPPEEAVEVYSRRILQRGAFGEDVELLQQALRDNGFNPGRINGIYGEETENAVMEFQRLNNFSVDGVAGEETLKALGLIDGKVTSQATSGYLVVIPITNRNTLAQVQQIVLNASEINSELGQFVNAGVFPNRDTAETMSDCLRSHGFDARVAYLR